MIGLDLYFHPLLVQREHKDTSFLDMEEISVVINKGHTSQAAHSKQLSAPVLLP